MQNPSRIIKKSSFSPPVIDETPSEMEAEPKSEKEDLIMQKVENLFNDELVLPRNSENSSKGYENHFKIDNLNKNDNDVEPKKPDPLLTRISNTFYELDSLKKTLETNFEEISVEKFSLKEKENFLKEKEKELKERELKVKEKEQQIKTREEKLKLIELQMREREAKLEIKEQMLNERESTLIKLEMPLYKKNLEINESNIQHLKNRLHFFGENNSPNINGEKKIFPRDFNNQFRRTSSSNDFFEPNLKNDPIQLSTLSPIINYNSTEISPQKERPSTSRESSYEKNKNKRLSKKELELLKSIDLFESKKLAYFLKNERPNNGGNNKNELIHNNPPNRNQVDNLYKKIVKLKKDNASLDRQEDINSIRSFIRKKKLLN